MEKSAALTKNSLSEDIKRWAQELGFQQAGITQGLLGDYEQKLEDWLEQGYHGEMDYMARYGIKRSRPSALIPGTKSIISVRMNYLPPSADMARQLQQSDKAFISRYALGRDYHKLIRKRLVKLAEKIESVVGKFEYRPFADSAPVMEKPLAEQAGLGWIGKNTNLLTRDAGSWFFLGTLYTNLDLSTDQKVSNHCGSCRACLDVCPTQAFVAPYQLDASRCISYLTIELKGSIPEELRPLIGNRIYGCDDCQMVCPWNRFAKLTDEKEFHPRHQLDSADLVTLFNWTEAEFSDKTKGSAIHRIGYERWLRNIAVALGNSLTSPAVIDALEKSAEHPSFLVREHVLWALEIHQKNKKSNT